MLVQKRLLPNEPIPDDWDLSRKKCRRLVHDLVGSLVRSQVGQSLFSTQKVCSTDSRQYLGMEQKIHRRIEVAQHGRARIAGSH